MTAPADPRAVLDTLYPRVSMLNQHYTRNETYYAGEIRREAMGLSVPPEVSRLQTIVNWCQVVVNAIEERLQVQGFRLSSEKQTNTKLWDIWEYNDLDHFASLGHIEALVQGRAWITVDVNPDDPDHPIVMPESADCMAVELDPKTRRITSALRRWYEEGSDGRRIDMATVYLPDETVYYTQGLGTGGWEEYNRIDHGLGMVPVVPLVNEARLPSSKYPLARWGKSELEATIPLVDAACRTLTNLQVAQEFLAVPSRYLLGVSPDEFKDQEGNPVSAWEGYTGRFNALSDPDGTAKVIQLAGADLQNFTSTLNTYAKLVSSVSGVPLRVFGVASDANPASAEAIAADEGRLVMRCWRKARSFGAAWEQAMRIAARIAGIDIPEATRLETEWADPATPTFAAKATALAALFASGLPLPKSYVWDVLDFTPEQRAAADAEGSTDPIVQLLKGANDQSSAIQIADGPANPEPGFGPVPNPKPAGRPDTNQ